MSISEEQQFTEAVRALEAGERERGRARAILTQLLKVDKENPLYWVYLTAAVATKREQIYCLKEALRLDPDNVDARRGLIILGALPYDESLAIPSELQHRNWQTKVSLPEEEKTAPKRPWWQYALAGGLAVLVLGVAVVLFLIQRRPATTERTIEEARLTATALAVLPTAEQTEAVSAKTTRTPTPLSLGLKSTYTPTPLYVNTPHNRIESFAAAMRAYQKGNWTAVVDNLKQVLVYEPKAPDVHYYLGEAYRFQGRYTDAYQAYNKALSYDPEFAPAFLGRARALVGSSLANWRDAQRDLQQALKLDPNYGEAYLEQAKLDLRLDLTQDALTQLDAAAELLPDSPEVFYLRAQANFALGNLDQALENARKANQLDVTDLDTYRLLGQILQAQGDLTGSLEPLQLYTSYKADDAQALAWLGSAYSAAGRSDDALDCFARAIRIDSAQPDAYIQRGKIYLDQQKYSLAEQDFKQALRFVPKSFDANMGLAQALLKQGKPGDAYMQFNKAEAYAVKDAQRAALYFWRAQSLEEIKENRAAERDWRALLALPADSAPQEWLDLANQHLLAMTSQPASSPTATLTPTASFTPALPAVTSTP